MEDPNNKSRKIKVTIEYPDGDKDAVEVDGMAAGVVEFVNDKPVASPLIAGTMSEVAIVKSMAAISAQMVEQMKARGLSDKEVKISFEAAFFEAMATYHKKQSESNPSGYLAPWLIHEPN